jgi:hypothetical protein
MCIIWLVSACENTDCITFSRNYIIVQFLDSANNKKDTTFSYITALRSNVIFYSDTTLDTYLLPINTNGSETTFIFGGANNDSDTLQVGYSPRERLISEECGFELQIREVEILYSSFPDVNPLQNQLSTLNEIDIEIYL